MLRDNKLEAFSYLDHRTVDGKNNIIVDVHATAGNVSDSDAILNRIEKLMKPFISNQSI